MHSGELFSYVLHRVTELYVLFSHLFATKYLRIQILAAEHHHLWYYLIIQERKWGCASFCARKHVILWQTLNSMSHFSKRRVGV